MGAVKRKRGWRCVGGKKAEHEVMEEEELEQEKEEGEEHEEAEE